MGRANKTTNRGHPINLSATTQPEPAATKPARKKISMIARLLFGLLTFLLLVYLFNPREVMGDLAKADLRFVAGGFGLSVLALLARTLKWNLILRRIGIHVSFKRLLEVYTISYWFNTILPGSIGGDLYKIYDLSRATRKNIRPAATVIIERLTGVLSLLAVAVAVLIVYRHHLYVPAWMIWLCIGFSSLATVGLLLVLLYFGPVWNLIIRLAPFLARILKKEKADSLIVVSNELRSNHRLFIEAFWLGVVVQVLVLSAYYVMALAISRDISAVYFFTLYPLIEIASMVPISINGIGIKEGLMVLSLQYSNITPAISMSMGILFRLIAIALALIGGVLLMIRKSSGWNVDDNRQA
jgi:glycosyltransferase 2 family protein